MSWTITNINSTDCTLLGTLHGDLNPIIMSYESFDIFSDGVNLYIK